MVNCGSRLTRLIDRQKRRANSSGRRSWYEWVVETKIGYVLFSQGGVENGS